MNRENGWNGRRSEGKGTRKKDKGKEDKLEVGSQDKKRKDRG